MQGSGRTSRWAMTNILVQYVFVIFVIIFVVVDEKTLIISLVNSSTYCRLCSTASGSANTTSTSCLHSLASVTNQFIATAQELGR